jgi:hypothetical protein
MPQHLWHVVRAEHWRIRVCEGCDARQITGNDPQSAWPPVVSTICPGDPDGGGRRANRGRPVAPAGAAQPARGDVSVTRSRPFKWPPPFYSPRDGSKPAPPRT